MHTSEPDPSPDPQRPETQLDFFHKLGYSTAQVQAVKQQFGPGMDTDKVLGELVRVGAPREAGPSPVTTMSVLLARGDIKAAGLNLQLPTATAAAAAATATATTTSSEESSEDEDALRPVVIDGSNVAMSHGNKEVFSCLGIQLTVNFFLDRGHMDVTVFVPSWRKEQPRPDVPITDQHILRDLERRKILVFTPSRRVAGKRVVCNDDWFIVKLAYESDGIIVSNDMYRDLKGREPEWKRFIEERLLMYSFVNNKFMPPDDPLGRHGPTLENFLRRHPRTQIKQPCPYGKKCTYGTKCKFHHPVRTKQSNDEFRENTKLPSTPQKQSLTHVGPVPGQSLLLVEDMAKKLTLGHDGVSSKTKKDQKREHVTQVKPSHRSGKKTSPRKEKIGRHSSDHGSVQHGGSEEQLDSGLGSIDSQAMEAPWSDHQHGGSYASLQHSHSVRQKFCPPRGAPCSCCSSQPPFHNQQYEPGPVSSHVSDISYNPPHFSNYGPYPLSMHAYSHPADLQHSRSHRHHHQQQQRYWSAPFAGPPSPPAAVRNPPGERTPWKPPQGTQWNPGGREEREAVRKKLMAIFSAELVDTAMEMSPQEMDPQVLVAEILMLQSQGRPLR